MNRPIKFRACEGFPKYEIGSDGSVWSLNYNNTGKRHILRQYLDKDGYPHVYFVVNRKRTKKVVHRLVATHFLTKPTPKHQVNHKNGVRNDNRLENLEWLTSRENTIDGWKRGRTVSEKHRENGRIQMKKVNRIKWPKHETA